MEALSERPVELRNYSVPGYNARQELAVLMSRVVPYKPDLIILHHDHNDAQDTGHAYPYDYFPPEYGDNFLGSAVFKLLIRKGAAVGKRISRYWNEESTEYLGGYAISGPLYDDHLVARRKFVLEADRNEIPVVAVIFNAEVEAKENWREAPEYLLLNKKISDELGGMGFMVMDLYPVYQSMLSRNNWPDLRRWWISEDELDAHPNPEGHAFIAEALIRFVRRNAEALASFEK